MEAVFCKVVGNPFNLEEHVERYKEHWDKSGVNWKTGSDLEADEPSY